MSSAHLLRNVSLFAQVSEDELEALASEFVIQDYRRGQTIFQQGSITSSLYIVKSGSIQITSFNPTGEVIYVGLYGPEQYFGEFSLLDGLPRSGEAVSLVHSELLVLNRPAFFRFLDSHPVVAIKLLVMISRRMRFAESAVEQSIVMSPDEKITRLLIDIGERYTTTSGEAVSRLSLRLTSDDLAGLSGVTRDVASNTVNDMRVAGIIEVERTHIVAADIPKLRARLLKTVTAIG